MSDSTPPSDPPAALKWRNLALLGLSQLLAMTLWFSASSVVPQLVVEWELSASAQSWMTMSVQIGFVAGAIVSAVLNLADRMPIRLFIAFAALAGGLCNATVVLAGDHVPVVVALRLLTGMTLAAVYPPGMKLVVTWTRRDRGLGIGFLIAALTIGSAMPHLINALPLFGDGGMPPWRSVVLTTSVMAGVSAFIMVAFVRVGPLHAGAAPFNWSFAGRALAHRPTRLANYGYLGHMWELYAMWTWVPVFLMASYEGAGAPVRFARLAGFAVIAAGGAGCILAGVLADRWGRTTVAAASLLISGVCAAAAGLLFHEPALLTALCVVWGFAVVADSGQFSAAVTELTDHRYIGTALTVQTCLGFLLTLLTIRLVPALLDAVGWPCVFLVLIPGPVFGIWSMLRLRREPEAVRMAGGRK